MPDDDPVAFNIYLNWVHKGVISMDIDEIEEKDTGGYDSWEVAILTYALGDKLLDIDFKDAITDAVAHMLSVVRPDGEVWSPSSVELLHLAYEKLARDCKLNLLIAHRLVRFSNIESLLKEEWPVGLLFNISRESIRKDTEGSQEDTRDVAARCAFHEHAPGAENCYRSKRG
jgi:hypothetical protein